MRAVFVVLALAACGDSPSSSGLDAGEPDAPASTDTALLVVYDAPGHPASVLSFADRDDVTLTVTNEGKATSEAVAVELAGPGQADVVLDPGSTCPGAVLAAAASCTIVLRYAPATDEARQVTLHLAQTADLDVVVMPVARPALRIAFAGGGIGEVQVATEELDSHVLATCTAPCRVRASIGQALRVTAATPQVFGGLAGACTAAAPSGTCTLTLATGDAVTATFTPRPGELWTRLLGGTRVMSAAYDGHGNLLVAADKITKLSPTGATLWQVALAVCSVATGPGDAVFGQTATTLYKLAADGTTLWTRPLDPHAVGCGIGVDDDPGYDGFLHNLAVGSTGAVAIHGRTGVAYWSADGTFQWSAEPAQNRYAVAIGPDGVVSALVASSNGESSDLARFAADGTALAPLEHVTVQYHGMFVIDATGRLLASSSGHSHTDDSLGHSVDLLDPDFAPNGICAAGAGAAWLYEPDDNSNFARAWVVNRYAADATLRATLTGTPANNVMHDPLGTNPHDLAGAADGHVAVAGGYWNTAELRETGWVTAFGP